MPVSKRAATGKLPAESTSFVGRRRLLAEVKAALTGTRLLTLVGPGGVGKTRLALRAAADLGRTVRDGVWFIDLAGLEDPPRPSAFLLWRRLFAAVRQDRFSEGTIANSATALVGIANELRRRLLEERLGPAQRRALPGG